MKMVVADDCVRVQLAAPGERFGTSPLRLPKYPLMNNLHPVRESNKARPAADAGFLNGSRPAVLA